MEYFIIAYVLCGTAFAYATLKLIEHQPIDYPPGVPTNIMVPLTLFIFGLAWPVVLGVIVYLSYFRDPTQRL